MFYKSDWHRCRPYSKRTWTVQKWPCRVADNTVWSHWQVASRSSEVNFTKNYTLLYLWSLSAILTCEFVRNFSTIYVTTKQIAAIVFKLSCTHTRTHTQTPQLNASCAYIQRQSRQIREDSVSDTQLKTVLPRSCVAMKFHRNDCRCSFYSFALSGHIETF